MRDEAHNPNGCNEKFAELCALFTSGELSAEETDLLNEHIVGCDECTALLREYTSVVNIGISKLAAARDEEVEAQFGPIETSAGESFIRGLHTSRSARPSIAWPSSWQSSNPTRGAALLWIGVAAVFLLCLGSSFEMGRRMASPVTNLHAIAMQAPALPEREGAQLKAELLSARALSNATSARSVHLEKQLAALSDERASLLAQIRQLTAKDDADSAGLASVTGERDTLQQQLSDATAALTRVRVDLDRTQQDRQGALFRVATLETEVNNLNTQLSHINNSASNDEQFLAEDRDIRELMGARQLYIADVFDVQNNGRRSKPFGRVFYTRGKSLIFYAFDLEKQPGFRETAAFQAWGKPNDISLKPVSLGIFYMDNEQNRRWVLKSSDPSILAAINAVFVTVEPRGGSTQPTSKPFLEAYLRTLAPNHP